MFATRRGGHGKPEPGSYHHVVPRSARDVAAVLRSRNPGLPTKKLHKLLYYCQAHHLATFGRPLFTERISAWDMGPVVGELWNAERRAGSAGGTGDLDEAELNTIGYVLSRYGALTGKDLENLAHSEPPWQLANAHRQPGASARIEIEWIREYFTGAGGGEADEDGVVLDSAELAEWLRGSGRQLGESAEPDEPEVIAERLRRLRTRVLGDG